MTTTAQGVSRLLGGVVPFDDLEAEHLATVFTRHAMPDRGRGELASVRWWSMGEPVQADDRFDPRTPRFVAKLNVRTV